MTADAPWIRDAEMYGMWDGPAVECPVCGEECEILYKDVNNEIVGCDQCMRTLDAADWYREQLEECRETEERRNMI